MLDLRTNHQHILEMFRKTKKFCLNLHLDRKIKHEIHFDNGSLYIVYNYIFLRISVFT